MQGGANGVTVRKGERVKKPSRYVQGDDIQLGVIQGRATYTHATPGQELNQAAKLLIKFINEINKKVESNAEKSMVDNKQMEQRKSNLQPSSLSPDLMIDKTDRKNTDLKASKSSGRPSIQTDLNYHSLLTQHIKTAFPNIGELTPDMLKNFSIPQKLLQQQSKIQKNNKDAQKKKEPKVFKRQSYHIAVAYDIYLKKMRESNKQETDPTLPAMRLKIAQK